MKNSKANDASQNTSSKDLRNPKPRRAYTLRQMDKAIEIGEVVELTCSTPGCGEPIWLHYTKAEKVESGEGVAFCSQCDLAEKLPDSEVAKIRARRIAQNKIERPEQTNLEADLKLVHGNTRVPVKLQAAMVELMSLTKTEDGQLSLVNAICDEPATNFAACMAAVHICRSSLDRAEKLLKDTLTEDYLRYQNYVTQINAVIDWEIDPDWKG